MLSTTSVQEQPPSSLFFKIPLELRFAIYEELLAPHSDPSQPTERIICKCQRCHEKRSRERKRTNPYKRTPLLFPSILSTNKSIHAEASMILYAKNTFQLACPDITTHPTNARIPDLCAPNSLVTLSSLSSTLNLKHAVLTFSCYARDELDNLPATWSWIEPMILAHYPNIQHLSLNLLRVNVPYRVLITMARKARDPEKEKKMKKGYYAQHMQNYLDSLAIRQCDANWEMKGFCDAVLPAEWPGLSEDSEFAIRSVQWSDTKKSKNLEKLSRGIFLE